MEQCMERGYALSSGQQSQLSQLPDGETGKVMSQPEPQFTHLRSEDYNSYLMRFFVRIKWGDV